MLRVASIDIGSVTLVIRSPWIALSNSASRGLFPFLFGRKATSFPLRVGVSVEPINEDSRKIDVNSHSFYLPLLRGRLVHSVPARIAMTLTGRLIRMIVFVAFPDRIEKFRILPDGDLRRVDLILGQ